MCCGSIRLSPRGGAAPCPPPAAHLGAQRAVAFEEVAADLSLPGHVHVAVGAAAVAADPLQEVGAHGHLRGAVREPGSTCSAPSLPDSRHRLDASLSSPETVWTHSSGRPGVPPRRRHLLSASWSLGPLAARAAREPRRAGGTALGLGCQLGGLQPGWGLPAPAQVTTGHSHCVSPLTS